MKQICVWMVTLTLLASMLASCEDGDETIAFELSSSIPSDIRAGKSPDISDNNISIPNVKYQEEEYEGEYVLRVDLTGLWNRNSDEWMYLYGTGDSRQNVWLDLDGSPKGFIIHNTIDDKDKEYVSQADLVFIVDNSGTMDDEANAVARDIIDWSKELDKSGTDIKFACVGYRYGNINGAIDFTDAESLSAFLNYSTDNYRTAHFGGSYASTLKSWADSFYKVDSECGAMAIRYADSYLSFRSGANRIYVNFTDEPNQPNYHSSYSTESFKNNWESQKGTIHTVYSADTLSFNETKNYEEKPWRLSWYTGGSILVTNSQFSGVDLSKLPVTGAIQNSYIIRFKIDSSVKDGKYHTLTVTVKSKDGYAQAKKDFSVNFGTL